MIWHPLPLRWVVYCVFMDCRMFYIINILNQHFYLATFARFYLSSTTLQYIEYNMEQDNTWVVGNAWLFWITRELHENANLWHMLNCNLFSNCSIARCGLNLVKKWDALSNNWPLMIAQTVKKLIAFCSRKFIACHSKSSILNNAGAMWCAKKSHMRVLM